MPRSFTSPQLAILESAGLRGRLLTTWFLDEGTYRFCDDVEDVTDGTNTWIGASALAVCADINSAQAYASESVQLTLDGTRMLESGFTDPAGLFRDILTYKLHQRRVNFAFGLSYVDVKEVSLIVPVYAGKINYARVEYPKVNFTQTDLPKPMPGNLIINMDSLAARYSRISGRTRSHQDQINIDPTDNYYQYAVQSAVDTQLYWGSKPPQPADNDPRILYNNYLGYIRRKV